MFNGVLVSWDINGYNEPKGFCDQNPWEPLGSIKLNTAFITGLFRAIDKLILPWLSKGGT